MAQFWSTAVLLALVFVLNGCEAIEEQDSEQFSGALMTMGSFTMMGLSIEEREKQALGSSRVRLGEELAEKDGDTPETLSAIRQGKLADKHAARLEDTVDKTYEEIDRLREKAEMLDAQLEAVREHASKRIKETRGASNQVTSSLNDEDLIDLSSSSSGGMHGMNAERKAKRAEKRAERKTKREEKRAERKTKREERQKQNQAKRATRQANRQQRQENRKNSRAARLGFGNYRDMMRKIAGLQTKAKSQKNQIFLVLNKLLVDIFPTPPPRSNTDHLAELVKQYKISELKSPAKGTAAANPKGGYKGENYKGYRKRWKRFKEKQVLEKWDAAGTNATLVNTTSIELPSRGCLTSCSKWVSSTTGLKKCSSRMKPPPGNSEFDMSLTGEAASLQRREARSLMIRASSARRLLGKMKKNGKAGTFNIGGMRIQGVKRENQASSCSFRYTWPSYKLLSVEMPPPNATVNATQVLVPLFGDCLCEAQKKVTCEFKKVAGKTEPEMKCDSKTQTACGTEKNATIVDKWCGPGKAGLM